MRIQTLIPAFCVLFLFPTSLAAQSKRVWVLRAPGAAVEYDPATFARTLDWIVAYGQGAQQGKGPPVGLPDTAINEIVAAGTRRLDFGGRF